MGLLGDGTVAHGPGFEAFDNAFYRLHLVHRDAAILRHTEVQQSPECVWLVGKVYQGRIFLEGFIAAFPDGFLQQEDGPWIVHMVLFVRTGAETVCPHGIQRVIKAQPQGIECLTMVPFYTFAYFLQAHALNTADGIGEILVHYRLVDAHTLKNLGGLIGLNGGNAHFRGNLHNAVKNSAVVIADSCTLVLVQHAPLHHLFHALLGQIRVNGLGAVAQEGGKVMHISWFCALQDHRDGRTLLGTNQILLQSADRQQGGNRNMVLIHTPVG